jgi:hypothetical protein
MKDLLGYATLQNKRLTLLARSDAPRLQSGLQGDRPAILALC